MRKYTLKELRELVRLGMAVDLTNANPDTLPTDFEKIGYSFGVYGVNGGLIQDRISGEYGVILGRGSDLFRLF